MWPILVASAMAQTSPLFDVICTPDGPVASADPIEVACSVEVLHIGGDPVGTWGTTQWLMGDGTLLKGDAITHTYTEPGVYTISVQLDDFVIQGDTGLVEVDSHDSLTRLTGFYTVCGLPEPDFELIDKGGLEYQVVNTTPVDQPRCIDTLKWTVKRRGASRTLHTFETWEPRFQLPEKGEYTVSLYMTGIAGGATNDLFLDAGYNLTSDYYRVHAQPCSTAPVGSVTGALVLLAVAAGRRRRR